MSTVNTLKCEIIDIIVYGRYVGHILDNVHSPGSGPIWLDDVECPDACISDLNQCNYSTLGSHDCNHMEDVYIACYDRDGKSSISIKSHLVYPMIVKYNVKNNG